jgi:hypothetical protein
MGRSHCLRRGLHLQGLRHLLQSMSVNSFPRFFSVLLSFSLLLGGCVCMRDMERFFLSVFLLCRGNGILGFRFESGTPSRSYNLFTVALLHVHTSGLMAY